MGVPWTTLGLFASAEGSTLSKTEKEASSAAGSAKTLGTPTARRQRTENILTDFETKFDRDASAFFSILRCHLYPESGGLANNVEALAAASATTRPSCSAPVVSSGRGPSRDHGARPRGRVPREA